MALKNGYYYVVNSKTKPPGVLELARYSAKANVFFIDSFAVDVSQCRAYSKYGYSAQDLLEIDTQLDDLVIRVLKLESIAEQLDQNNITGAVRGATEYLNDHVYFDPAKLMSIQEKN